MGGLGARAAIVQPSTGAGPLTPRQQELLVRLAEGITMDTAAREMGISRSTAFKYRAQILDRLNVATISQAWQRLGWLRLPD